MKIAYIAASCIPSTTANSIQVMKVCQALTQNGNQVHLYVPGNVQTDWNSLRDPYGITTEFAITWLKSRRSAKRFDFIFSALTKAKNSKADLVYTRLLWAAVGAQWLHIPVILELHDLPAGRFGPYLFQRYLNQRGKKLTVLITHSLKLLLESIFSVKFTADQCLLAPDGIDLERYNDLPSPEQAREELHLQNTMTAAYSGGFYEGRGLETILELAGKFPKIQFLMIGGKAEMVNQWKEKVKDLGLTNVVLTGFVPNAQLPLYQAAADILLMPYNLSFGGSSGGNIAAVSSPMKMFEYMACGRPILLSNIAVLREVLNDQNALFYTPEDFSDLCHKFELLLSDLEKRKRLAQQAQMDVQKYSWRERMQKILTVFGKADA